MTERGSGGMSLFSSIESIEGLSLGMRIRTRPREVRGEMETVLTLQGTHLDGSHRARG